MPFSLMNAPFTFQRMIDNVFSYFSYAQVYLDDIVVAPESIEDHSVHLKEVLKRIKKLGLNFKVSKFEFVEEEI